MPSSHLSAVHDETEGARMSAESASPVSPLTSPPPPPPTGAAAVTLPEKRKLPPFPEGDITQQEGEAFCRLITMNRVEVLLEQELMSNIQESACSPNEDIASVSISQVIGETPKAAWDILPLTPNSSTGRCPFELVKQGPIPSMFPRLTASSKQQQRSETTAVQHSVAKLRKRRQFEEGEEVVVYDAKTKLSSKGKISEVLGNNTYLADCGGGPKHVSGDLVSRVSATSQRSIGGGNVLSQDLGEDNAEDIGEDNVSICSESSFGSEILDFNIENVAAPQNVNRVRRRRRMVDRLDQPQADLPRLRPLRHR